MNSSTISHCTILAGTTALVLALGALSVPATAATVSAEPNAELLAQCPWMDASKSTTERAQSLLDASSLHQKYRWLDEQSANSPSETTFGEVSYPEQVPCTPKVVYSNGPQGVATTPGVSAFPVPLGTAATWNTDLSYERAAAHGSEAFDKGSSVVLGPGVSSSRTPLAGRTAEYYGEDSLLSGLMAGANIRGLEQGNPDKPVIANLKHYVANEQETDRQTSSSNMDDRTFHEVYGLPFEIAVAHGDPHSAMCSYNQINGVYACENPIMNEHLRGEAGFDGYIMSDFGAVHSTAAALKAGLDQELNRPIWYTPERLDAAIAAGEITAADIDKAAFNVVSAYIDEGLFDHPVPETPVENVRTPAHEALSQEIAEQGSVLLKNSDRTLPLPPTAGETIAVIGQTASATPTNGVSATTVCSSYLTFTHGPVQTCDGLVDPLTAFTQKANELGQTILYDDGADPTAAAQVASQADAAIVFGYYTSGEFSDIPDLHLDGNGDELIEAVAGANDHTVAVLQTGSAVEMPWIDSVSGVIEAWYTGDQVGPALTRLLWGEVSPSGKLPMTFPKSLADTPTSTPEQYPGVFSNGSTTNPGNEIRQVDYAEGLKVGYKWYDAQGIDPLFPFGFGLSYTTFDYSDLKVSSSQSNDGNATITASFTVTNSGSMAGAEIPQVYLALPEAAAEPGKRLVGFDRIVLDPGQSQRVTVTIDSAAANHPLSIWNTDTASWQIANGVFDVSVGRSSRDLPLNASVPVDFVGNPPAVDVNADPAQPNGNDGWYLTPIQIGASATDDIDPDPAIEYRLDGSEWQDYAGDVVVDQDGDHALEVRATDAGGNISESATWTGKLDSTAPVVSADADRRARTVTLTASDSTSGIDRIEYSTTGGTDWTRYDHPITVEGDDATVTYRAWDVAGNASAAKAIRVSSDGASPGHNHGADAKPHGGALANTGSTTWPYLLAAMLMVSAGAAFFLVRRRRQQHR